MEQEITFEDIAQLHKDNIDFLTKKGFESYQPICSTKDGRYYTPFHSRILHSGIDRDCSIFVKLYSDRTVSAEVSLNTESGYGQIGLHLRHSIPGLDEKIKKVNDEIDSINNWLIDKLYQYIDEDVTIDPHLYRLADESSSEMGVYSCASAEEAYNKIIENIKSLQSALK